jgi:uncharacterized membrane protein YhaH (DUF805 family)
MSSVARFFTWHGRLSRASWLARTLLAASIAIAFGMLAAALAGERGAAIVAALFAWSAASLATRRLHDIGKSAWALVVVVVPIAGPLWLLFQLTRAGVEGRNRHGPDPDARFDYLQVDIAR